MSRHPLDHQAPSDGGRMKHFSRVAREDGAEGSHPASRSLLKRPAARDEARRAVEYSRIERGADEA